MVDNLTELKSNPEPSQTKPTTNPLSNIKEEDLIECPSCSGKLLTQAHMYTKISAIMSGTGKPEIGYIPGPLICLSCGKILEEEEIKKQMGVDKPSGLIMP